jgi:hypothetical protein
MNSRHQTWIKIARYILGCITSWEKTQFRILANHNARFMQVAVSLLPLRAHMNDLVSKPTQVLHQISKKFAHKTLRKLGKSKRSIFIYLTQISNNFATEPKLRQDSYQPRIRFYAYHDIGSDPC